MTRDRRNSRDIESTVGAINKRSIICKFLAGRLKLIPFMMGSNRGCVSLSETASIAQLEIATVSRRRFA